MPFAKGLAAVRGLVAARPLTVRWLLAGPVAILAGLATMMAMPLWFPAGAAGINHVAWPILLTPLLWAGPFFYACLEENLERGLVVLLGATLIQGAMIALALT